MSNATVADIVSVWSRVVEVQMHFNSIAMTVRNIYATIVVGILAAIGFATERGMSIHIGGEFPLGVALAALAFGITWLFYFMDRYWYHKLLLGSVKAASELEKKLTNEGVPVDLTAKIGKESRIETNFRGRVRYILSILIRDKRFRDDGHLHSDGKISLFYSCIMVAFALVGILLFFVGPVESTRPADTAGAPIVMASEAGN